MTYGLLMLGMAFAPIALAQEGAAPADGTAAPAASASPPAESGPAPPAAPADGSTGTSTVYPPHRPQRHLSSGYDRFENGFDAKLTSIYGRTGSNVGSPTVMVSAQWNYKLPSDTYFGATASGLPQPHAKTENNTIKRFSTYYGGLNVAQDVWDADPLRVTVAVGLGAGIFYLRTQVGDADPVIGSTKYKFAEPALYATFIRYKGLDIGAIASYRMVKVDDDTVIKNSDLSSVTYGVTFRTQHQ